jgi:hypothetical protein
MFASVLACPASAQLTLPWHRADAPQRVVFRISTPFDQREPTATLPLGFQPQNLLVVDAARPDVPLPVYTTANGCVLRLPDTLQANQPRHLVAYTGGTEASPLLSEPPEPSSDFARTVLGRAWDFDDGTTCGIASWGNGPGHFGPVSVKDGWLQIPVKGHDPYFIFGDMFGAADSPRALHIDSAVYRYLELRVRQSCADAEWQFFITDGRSRYKTLTFNVRGTEPRTFRFDLRALFPDFWDGRAFRALRIDTTNDKKDVLAEVDYVRLLPDEPAVLAGPVFTRESVAARDAVASLSVKLPRSLTAGERAIARVKGDPLSSAIPLTWAFVSDETGKTVFEGTARPTFPSRRSHVPAPVRGRSDWPTTSAAPCTPFRGN